MIRKLKLEDLDEVMKIWVEANIEAHDFITEAYWKDNADLVRTLLPQAEVYVYEEKTKIRGFIGIQEGYVAGLFVEHNARRKGIGKALLSYCMDAYKSLTLKVYEKNTGAATFYQKQGFKFEKQDKDKQTGEMEWVMRHKAYSISGQ